MVQAERSPVPLVIRAGPELTLATFLAEEAGQGQTSPTKAGWAHLWPLPLCSWLDRARAPPILLEKHQRS